MYDNLSSVEKKRFAEANRDFFEQKIGCSLEGYSKAELLEELKKRDLYDVVYCLDIYEGDLDRMRTWVETEG